MNLIGRQVIISAKHYEKVKNRYKDFEDFLVNEVFKHILVNEEAIEIISKYEDKFYEKGQSITNDEILSLLVELKAELYNKKRVTTDFDTLEFMGYIFLNRIYNEEKDKI